VKPWINLATAPGPDGIVLSLHQRDTVYSIRAGGRELMSSALHGSEDAMAAVGLKGLAAEKPRVLIGGLGLGYTVRATLDRLPSNAVVVVAEISQAIVDWCRQLSVLSGDALSDPRVTVQVTEIGALLGRTVEPFHVVLLDVDNGPSALTRRGNQHLYGTGGLRAFRNALYPGGALVVWSAGPDARFEQKLLESGFSARVLQVPARPGSKARHTLFVARRSERAFTSPSPTSSSRTSGKTSPAGRGRFSGRPGRGRRTR